MDLEVPDRKSDLYQNLLSEHRRSSNHYKRSSGVSRNDIFSRISRQSDHHIDKIQPQNFQFHNERNSRSSVHKHVHECNCTHNECNQQHCSCFLYPNQLCLIGLCCPNCIKSKNQYLMQSEARQKQIPVNNVNGCLCKNIKCLKLYCRCFREGKKCDPTVCKCDRCENLIDGLLQKKKKRIQFQLRKQHFMQQNGITMRQNYLLSTIKQGNQVAIDPASYSFINCACKRSHCLKKYCSCFLHNKPCTEACACEQCHNIYDENDHEDERDRKQRYARHNDDEECSDMDDSNAGQIDRFLAKYERNYQNEQMNEHMEFEPVNFEDAIGH